MNKMTVNLLASLLEVFATARSAIATYAIAMAVTGGDQTFSLFTTAVIEGALVISMLSIGLDPVSPLTALLALVFSAVMQYLEVVTLQGVLSIEEKRTLVLALAFAPTVLLALGILRRLAEGPDNSVSSVFSKVGGLFKRKVTGSSPVNFSASALNDLPVRKCSECGTEFEALNAKRLTCSDTCRKARQRRLSRITRES